MTTRIGFAEFDAKGVPFDAHVGWAEFDVIGVPFNVNVGWAQFDALGQPFNVCVGWAELDCRSPNDAPIPPFRPGGGTRRYHSDTEKQYQIPVDSEEEDEEAIILTILMEIAKNELLDLYS